MDVARCKRVSVAASLLEESKASRRVVACAGFGRGRRFARRDDKAKWFEDLEYATVF